MKIGIYARVSTKDQDNENQIAKLRSYAGLRDWDVVDIYQDEITGRKFSRHDLDRLKQDIKKGRVSGVLVWKLDRLGRSLRDLIDLSEFFKSHGASLIIFGSNIDTTTPEGKMFFQINGAFAEFERSLISDRTKLAYDRKKAHAKNLNQKVKWGRRSKKLSDEEISIVSELRSLGASWRSIASEINEFRSVKDEELLSYSTIRRLFQNRSVDFGMVVSSND